MHFLTKVSQMTVAKPRWVALILGSVLNTYSLAGVTQFEVLQEQPQALQARVFGAAGTARKIVARATIAVDPADPRNQGIADLALGPRDAQGQVRADADVVILQPQHPNGRLLVEVPNRGRKLIGLGMDNAPAQFDRLSQASDAGDGFLLSQGYTLAWIGWQGDIPSSGKGSPVGIQVPTLAGMTGACRDEWVFTAQQSAALQTVKLAYPVANRDGTQLTARARLRDARTQPASLSWRFIDDQTLEIQRPADLPADAIYEFTYTARDPKLLGLGFAALRDVAQFLREDGSAANPLARGGHSPISQVLGLGISQSGRVLRDFLYFGFNETVEHRPVYDGLLLQIPGARRSFTNERFGQPARNPGPNNDDIYPVAAFPRAFEASTDPATGRIDGLLQRCRATQTCPRIMQIDSEYEFWSSLASLNVTDARGQALALPPEVRAYLVAGTQHFVMSDAQAKAVPNCRLPDSPIYAGPLMRALLVALDDWVSLGTQPPASRYPQLTNGGLVRADSKQLYAGIPGLGYHGSVVPALQTDGASGLPRITGNLPLLVARTDADGHALQAVRLPAVAAPRASYVGWNSRRDDPAGLCTQTGATLPLAATRAERLRAGDHRLSIAERYPAPGDYEAAVRAAAWRLVLQGLMLPADAAAAVREAQAGTLARLGNR